MNSNQSETWGTWRAGPRGDGRGNTRQNDTQGGSHGKGDPGGMEEGPQDWGSQLWGNPRELLGRGMSWRTKAVGWAVAVDGEGILRKVMFQGEEDPEEGLTSSILVHHAQPLCLVLPLEGIEVQDTGERVIEVMRV